MSASGGPNALDLTLLRGFEYACRPDCGLCCYAEPRLEGADRAGLLQIAPGAEVDTHPSGDFLRARPDGGACQFLDKNRCRVWSARPGLCRQFPITVHVGVRLQATLVLSCPGVDLACLAEPGPWANRPEPRGFDLEVAAARARITPSTARRLEEARRRRRRALARLERAGRWVDEDRVRDSFRASPPLPTPAEFPVPDPPSVNGGLENLPLLFDHRAGPVALAAGLGGWELHELRAEGGAELREVLPPPVRPPETSAGGRRLLEGYLRYFIERDALFGAVVSALEPGDRVDVAEAVAAELRAIGALVLSRADVRRRTVRPARGPLTEADVENGIRACDQELLDRPTWGDRL